VRSIPLPENCANSHRSFVAVDRVRTKIATFCHVFPEGKSSMTFVHLYRPRSALYKAISNSGRFQRAIVEKGLQSRVSGDFGRIGYNRCRMRFSEVCHCTSMIVESTSLFQTISMAVRFQCRHTGRAFRHKVCRGKSFKTLSQTSCGRECRFTSSYDSRADLSLRRGGLTGARGIQQHNSDISRQSAKTSFSRDRQDRWERDSTGVLAIGPLCVDRPGRESVFIRLPIMSRK